MDGISHNTGYLCPKGRFGYRYMLEKDRLTKPLIRKRGRWQEATWDEAIKYTGQKLKEIIAASGAQSVAAFASPKMKNEELYLLQKFVRAGLKTNNVGSFSTLSNGIEKNGLDAMFGLTVSTATMDDLKEANVIVVINSDPGQDNLVAELKIKAALKKGAKVVTVASSEIPLVKFSEMWVDSKRGTNTALLNGLCRSILNKKREDASFISAKTEGFEAFKKAMAAFDAGPVSEITGVNKEKLESFFDLVGDPANKVVVVYGIDTLWDKSKNDLQAIGNYMMLSGRAAKPGNGIIVLRDFANAQGLLDMGVDPKYLPGYVKPTDAKGVAGFEKLWGVPLKDVFKPVDLRDAMEKDKIKALIVFGEDPLFAASKLKLTGGAEFMVVVDSFMTETAKQADVVLPAALPIEAEGTVTACDRRVQKTARIFEPAAGMENGEILEGLAKAMGIDLAPKGAKAVADEIGKAVPFYKKLAEGGFWGKDLFEKGFLTADGKAHFALFELDVTPPYGEKERCLFDENYFDTTVGKQIGRVR